MSDGIGSKVEGLLDGMSDINRPPIVELCRKLKRYADAEKGIVTALNTMRTKAAGLVVYGLKLADWAKKAKGPDADAFKKRAKEFDKAISGFESFTDAIDGVLEGTASGKTSLPGEEFQKILDKLEFSDKAAIAALRKAAQDYYPAESAGQKKLNEWPVHLVQLAAAPCGGSSHRAFQGLRRSSHCAAVPSPRTISTSSLRFPGAGNAIRPEATNAARYTATPPTSTESYTLLCLFQFTNV